MQLFFIIFIVASTTLAGIFVTAALVIGLDGPLELIIAVTIGVVVARFVAWIAARKIRDL